MLRRENEKASLTSLCLDLKPPYVADVKVKPYPVGYVTSLFQKFDGQRGNPRKHIVHFLEPINAHGYVAKFCMSSLSPKNTRLTHGTPILSHVHCMIGSTLYRRLT